METGKGKRQGTNERISTRRSNERGTKEEGSDGVKGDRTAGWLGGVERGGDRGRGAQGDKM